MGSSPLGNIRVQYKTLLAYLFFEITSMQLKVGKLKQKEKMQLQKYSNCLKFKISEKILNHFRAIKIETWTKIV